MPDIHANLEKIGFSPKGAQIYLALLNLGSASVIEIAQKTKLKRTSVYNILPDLIQQGFVKTAVQQKRRIFYIEDVRQLERSLDEKHTLIHDILPELHAIHNVLPYKPKITYYEGESGAKEFFQDTLESTPSGGIIREMIGPQAFYTSLPKGFASQYIPERIHRKIQIRIIASPSTIAKQMHLRDAKELREMRFVPNLNTDFYAGMEIYANKLGFISFRENFMGVIMESRDVHALQSAAFDALWNTLKQ